LPVITVSGTPIDFPDSAASPNWAPAVIQFAQLVATALTASVGPFDVPPQVYTMPSNVNTNVNIPSLAFPTATVRAAFIKYSVYRTTNSSTAYEAGNMVVVYNANGTPGSLWELINSHEGNGDILFNITDTGQLQYTTTSLSGSNHVGTISFSGQALTQS
jgi:hypothetical protein